MEMGSEILKHLQSGAPYFSVPKSMIVPLASIIVSLSSIVFLLSYPYM